MSKFNADINSAGDGWIQVTISGDTANTLTEAQIASSLSTLPIAGEEEKITSEWSPKDRIFIEQPSFIIEVKELEWLPISYGDEVANTILGTYTITAGSPYLVWFAGQADDEDYAVSATNMELAKAAAQADYETRVLSALISSPGKDGGQEVEAENRALRKIISDAASALPNGAFIHPEASVGFMEGLPKEIALVCSRPQPASTALVERLQQLHAEQHRILGEMLLDKSEEGQAKANWQGGKVNGIAAALSASQSTSSEGER